MQTSSIKQFLGCKFTIKHIIYFTVEVRDVLENLDERLLLEWSFADGRFLDLL